MDPIYPKWIWLLLEVWGTMMDPTIFGPYQAPLGPPPLVRGTRGSARRRRGLPGSFGGLAFKGRNVEVGMDTNRIYYTILYYTILYYTILYYTILYYTILYYTILYYTIL